MWVWPRNSLPRRGHPSGPNAGGSMAPTSRRAVAQTATDQSAGASRQADERRPEKASDAMNAFTVACAGTFSAVYFLPSVPLFWPYVLMAVQMVAELLLQPDMASVMRVHHLANLGVTLLYLAWPTFDPIIREGLAVEVRASRTACRALSSRRSRACDADAAPPPPRPPASAPRPTPAPRSSSLGAGRDSAPRPAQPCRQAGAPWLRARHQGGLRADLHVHSLLGQRPLAHFTDTSQTLPRSVSDPTLSAALPLPLTSAPACARVRTRRSGAFDWPTPPSCGATRAPSRRAWSRSGTPACV